MKLLFKQKLFSWLDSYDIFDEEGRVVYKVEGKLAWTHRLHIFDAEGVHVATLMENIWTFLRPKFELRIGDRLVGVLIKELTWFKPRFKLDFNGWQVAGDWLEWDYSIADAQGNTVAVITKELWKWTDTYAIDVANPADALCALMVTLAIDAEKCARNS